MQYISYDFVQYISYDFFVIKLLFAKGKRCRKAIEPFAVLNKSLSSS